MIKIERYIQRSRKKRQEHLRLKQACVKRGGNSAAFRGVLAVFLNTTIPSGNKIHACHACNCESCSNPRHLYWGTPKENKFDAIKSGKALSSIWDYVVRKYGYKEACKMNKDRADPSKAGRGNKGKTKTKDHKQKIAESLRKRSKGK